MIISRNDATADFECLQNEYLFVVASTECTGVGLGRDVQQMMTSTKFRQNQQRPRTLEFSSLLIGGNYRTDPTSKNVRLLVNKYIELKPEFLIW
jgi:hypothetical protein